MPAPKKPPGDGDKPRPLLQRIDALEDEVAELAKQVKRIASFLQGKGPRGPQGPGSFRWPKP
ncbi:MAG: hypothetical protein AB7U73_07565 [Pirellulales bacterium]